MPVAGFSDAKKFHMVDFLLMEHLIEHLPHIFEHAIIDTLKLVPFLFVTYLFMEYIEHKAGSKAEEVVQRAGSAGPIIGALLGAFPQCGFSAAAATLYAGRVITLGTVFAVFLATSDEMIPILIAEQADPLVIGKILAAKVIIGMVMGFIVDAFVRLRDKYVGQEHLHIHDLCEQDHCHCEEGSVLKSSIRHTLQVTLFIFLITLVLNVVIEFFGEESLAAFLGAQPVLAVFASALVGLIPNCAASVVITELFLQGALSAGAMMGGLLVSAGVGLLVLFRTNRPMKNNLMVLGALWIIGVLWGLGIDALGIAFM